MSLQSFIETACPQVATYWGLPVPDGRGNMSRGDPVELRVRWDDSTKLIKDDKGKEVACRAEVLVAGRLQPDGSLVPIDLVVDGMLYLSALDDIDSSGQDDPLSLGAWPIIRFDKVPEFASTEDFVRTAYL